MDTQLDELSAVLNEINYKDDDPEPKKKVIKNIKNSKGKVIDIGKIKKARNPDITGLPPAERLKLLRKRKMNEKYFKALIKPGAFTGTTTLEEAIAEAKDDYKKFVGSSESPYYKWYVLHFLGVEIKDHSLERKFALKRAFTLWNFFRSSYGRTAMDRQILGTIVKHLNVDYMTKMYMEFIKLFKVKTDVQFGVEPKVYKYTMDEEETTLRKKDGEFTKDATKALKKALESYINTHKKNSNFLKAYAKHLANKNPAEAKEYVENYNNTVNLIRTLIKQKEEFERLINNTTKQIKDTEFKIKTAMMKLHRLKLKPFKEIFYAEEHPADMPAEFKPKLPEPEEPPKRPRDKSEYEDEDDTTTKKTRFGADASDDEELLKLFDYDMSLFNI